ncbi:DNA-methyltransferase [Pseudarthrobacter sp. NPDC055928]|uniref:DNA-methyltransferase n=1 Tax=Pseudarthrobacter sp. NPDC055928 TaxID=3345661 RepID=UPI0035DB72C7
MGTYELHHGDCVEVMRTMPDSSVDSIVTDPPYGLGFMGKAWDALPPGREWAEECLRVLKPGGHLLAFGGTRTWHRLAVAIEDAGFELRDSIAWMYGSGFPKHRAALKPAFEPIVMARKPFKGSLTANEAIHGTGALDIDGCRIQYRSESDKQSAKPQGAATALIGALAGKVQSWESSTALKESSTTAETTGSSASPSAMSASTAIGTERKEFTPKRNDAGRWPANVMMDEYSACALDAQSGVTKSGSRKAGTYAGLGYNGSVAADFPAVQGDSGGASRFFYVSKAPPRERPKVDGVTHATVKPLDLMRWLVRLVTPKGGTVLEPFAGSGTTVEACILEGFHCIAIEREAEYLPLIQARIDRQEVA